MDEEPITPDQISEQKAKILPKEVIKSFNEMILSSYDGVTAEVEESAVCELIVNKINERADSTKITQNIIYSNRWLEIEDLYSKAGWEVKYDKPDYHEHYPSVFIFTKKSISNHNSIR